MREKIISFLLNIGVLKIVCDYKYCECGERLSEWFKADKHPTNPFKTHIGMRCYTCCKISEHKRHNYDIKFFFTPTS